MLQSLSKSIRNGGVLFGAAVLAVCGGDGKVTTPDEEEPSVRITAVRQAATGQPVDPNNVQDSIQVVVEALNAPAGSCVQLLVNATVVGQCMPVARPHAGGMLVRRLASLASSSTIEIVLPVNTAVFNATSGAPQFNNGQCTLSALVKQPSGVTAATSSSFTVRLNNQNFLAGQIAFGAGPVTGNGQTWYAPPVMVTAKPIIFDANAVSDVTVRLSPAAGSAVTATANAANGYVATFPAAGFLNATGAYTLSATSTYTNGSAGPSALRGIVNLSFSLDSKPPASWLLAVPSNRWLNSTFLYTPSGPEPANDGAGGVVTRYGYTLVGSNNFIALTDPLQIPQTSSNNVYELTTERTDGLQNRAIYKASPAVGADFRKPTLNVNFSGRFTNPAVGQFWTRTDSDPTPGSGIDLAWRRLSIGHYETTRFTCVFGNAANNCATALNNNTPVPIFPNAGLIQYRAEVWDLAGNITLASLDVLNDASAPAITVTTAPNAAPAAGANATITATIVENLDIDNVKLEQRFGTATSTFDLALGANLLGSWGPPLQFGNFNTQFTQQYYPSYERTDSLGRPNRTIYASIGYGLQARDQARNRTDVFIPHGGGLAALFSYADSIGRVNFRGPVQLKVESSDTLIPSCPAGHSSTIVVDVTTANGRANPFANGMDVFAKIDMVPFKVGRVTAPTFTETGTGPEARTYTFTFSYVAATAPWTTSGLQRSPGNDHVFAVGVGVGYNLVGSRRINVQYCR